MVALGLNVSFLIRKRNTYILYTYIHNLFIVRRLLVRRDLFASVQLRLINTKKLLSSFEVIKRFYCYNFSNCQFFSFLIYVFIYLFIFYFCFLDNRLMSRFLAKQSVAVSKNFFICSIFIQYVYLYIVVFIHYLPSLVNYILNCREFIKPARLV